MPSARSPTADIRSVATASSWLCASEFHSSGTMARDNRPFSFELIPFADEVTGPVSEDGLADVLESLLA